MSRQDDDAEWIEMLENGLRNYRAENKRLRRLIKLLVSKGVPETEPSIRNEIQELMESEDIED